MLGAAAAGQYCSVANPFVFASFSLYFICHLEALLKFSLRIFEDLCLVVYLIFSYMQALN